MMEKKYQLVAWTENICENESARLFMIPSLECEVQASLVSDLAFIHASRSFGRPLFRSICVLSSPYGPDVS